MNGATNPSCLDEFETRAWEVSNLAARESFNGIDRLKKI